MVTLLFHFSNSVFAEGGSLIFGEANSNRASPQNNKRIVNSIIIIKNLSVNFGVSFIILN